MADPSPKRIVDLPVEAGVYSEQTPRGAMGRWKDGNKIRFRYGLVEKIGGWGKRANEFIGLARRLWDWSSLDSRVWVAIGTESKLYVEESSTQYDITPIRRTVPLGNNPFTTTNGNDIVAVADTSHGAQLGDYVTFSGALSFNNFNANGEFRIIAITGINSYNIQSTTTPNASGAGGGAAVIAEYQTSVGNQSSAPGVGWGTGVWSAETWNTPRTTSTTIELLRTWSLDNWGEDLIAVPRGNAMYIWDRSNGPTNRAKLIDGSPLRCNYALVSQRDRHLFAFGCTDEFTGKFDPLLIRWCDQENLNDWIPTSTNSAGDLRIFRGSQIEAAVRTRGEILVFTNVSVHQITYIGGNEVYGIQQVGENVSIAGPNAAIEVDQRIFFMAEKDFYVFDGVLSVLPCEVRNRVFDAFKIGQRQKAFAGLNREFNEIWWFYPATDDRIYFEDDFTVSNNASTYRTINDLAGTNSYTWTFNPTFSRTEYDQFGPDPGVAVGWIKAPSDTLVPDHTNFEMQAACTTEDSAAQSFAANIFLNFDDENQGPNDNIGFAIGVNVANNSFQIWRKRPSDFFFLIVGTVFFNNVSPPIFPDNDPYDWVITVKRTPTQIAMNVFDERQGNFYENVLVYNLTAQDQIDFNSVTNPRTGFGNVNSPNAPDKLYLRYFATSQLGALSENQGAAQVENEPGNYVIYNYEDNTWATGTLIRTAWADRSPAFEKPYAAGNDNRLYEHETGVDDDVSAMTAFVETYDMEIPDSGENLMHIDQFIPDFLELQGTANVTLRGKKYPTATEEVKGPYAITSATTKQSTRIRGRQVSMRIESSELGGRFRLGTMRMRARPHGKRA